MPTRMQDGGALVRVGATTAAIAFDGRRKNKNGIFTGRRPKWLPAEMVRELTKRRLGRAHALLSHSTIDAVKLLRVVVNDDQADTQHRLKAAETILNRVMGMPRESVQLDVMADIPPWQRLMNDAIQTFDELKTHRGIVSESDVIEGEVIEDEAEPPSPEPTGLFDLTITEVELEA